MTVVACHDAGGAEILSSLVRRTPQPWRFVLAGPAVAIFTRKLGPVRNDSVDVALIGADRLICGTSLPSTWEWDALAAARRAGVPSIAVLDHWINYRERFVRNGIEVLPDELWVVDETAEAAARATFPGRRITRIENPFRLDVIERWQARTARDGTPPGPRTALYVTEPTSEHAARMFGDPRYWGYTETEALRWFLSAIPRLDPAVTRIVVRPHPSESPAKYAFVPGLSPVEAVVRTDGDLLDEIQEAALVAGCNSAAMVVATWAHKRVICCMPPEARGYALPVAGIEFAARSPV